MYTATMDMRVRLDDLIQVSVSNPVNDLYQIKVLNESIPRHTSGVIMVARDVPYSIPAWQQLFDDDLPVVMINSFNWGFGEAVPPHKQPLAYVGTDNNNGAYQVVQKFLQFAKCNKVAVLDTNFNANKAGSADSKSYPINSTFNDVYHIPAGIFLMDSSNEVVAASQILAVFNAGFNCFFQPTTSAIDIMLRVMNQLTILGQSNVYVATW